jgi:hypothetical protein
LVENRHMPVRAGGRVQGNPEEAGRVPVSRLPRARRANSAAIAAVIDGLQAGLADAGVEDSDAAAPDEGAIGEPVCEVMAEMAEVIGPAGRQEVFAVNGRLVTAPQHINWACRGVHLEHLSLVEYACTVSIRAKRVRASKGRAGAAPGEGRAGAAAGDGDSEGEPGEGADCAGDDGDIDGDSEDEGAAVDDSPEQGPPRPGPGRPSNSRFDFTQEHPLHETHEQVSPLARSLACNASKRVQGCALFACNITKQVMRSLLTVPIISGRCPPLPGPPPPASAPQGAHREWQRAADLCGAFYLSILVCCGARGV